jgi:hypothetical protein
MAKASRLLRRTLIVLFLFSFGNHCFGQDAGLLKYRNKFDRELNAWTGTFKNFNLSDFRVYDTILFENVVEQDVNYTEFLKIYGPIVVYSPDSSAFIDIYSYQLNLEKRGNVYYANPEIDQAVYLCVSKRKNRRRIYFGTAAQWIDDVLWTSKTNFILVGITKTENNKKTPLILLGDANRQKIVRYMCSRKDVIQHGGTYISPALKKMAIKGF